MLRLAFRPGLSPAPTGADWPATVRLWRAGLDSRGWGTMICAVVRTGDDRIAFRAADDPVPSQSCYDEMAGRDPTRAWVRLRRTLFLAQASWDETADGGRRAAPMTIDTQRDFLSGSAHALAGTIEIIPALKWADRRPAPGGGHRRRAVVRGRRQGSDCRKAVSAER